MYLPRAGQFCCKQNQMKVVTRIFIFTAAVGQRDTMTALVRYNKIQVFVSVQPQASFCNSVRLRHCHRRLLSVFRLSMLCQLLANNIIFYLLNKYRSLRNSLNIWREIPLFLSVLLFHVTLRTALAQSRKFHRICVVCNLILY